MTEEQFEKARFIKSGINKCESIYPNDRIDVCVSLGNEVNEKIKKIIEERLEEFKKEFEEL